jgi:hypothetical protein
MLTEPLRDNLSGLELSGPQPAQLAWIHGLLGHPAFALDLCRYAADFVGALPAERQEFWKLVAAHAAGVNGLPVPAEPRSVDPAISVVSS